MMKAMTKTIQNNTTENNRILLHLSLIETVGPSSIISLIQSLGTKDQRLLSRDLWYEWSDLDLTQLYSFTVRDCQELAGLTFKTATQVVEGLADTTALDSELALLETHLEIRYLTILDDEYPKLLKQIYLAS